MTRSDRGFRCGRLTPVAAERDMVNHSRETAPGVVGTADALAAKSREPPGAEVNNLQAEALSTVVFIRPGQRQSRIRSGQRSGVDTIGAVDRVVVKALQQSLPAVRAQTSHDGDGWEPVPERFPARCAGPDHRERGPSRPSHGGRRRSRAPSETTTAACRRRRAAADAIPPRSRRFERPTTPRFDQTASLAAPIADRASRIPSIPSSTTEPR